MSRKCFAHLLLPLIDFSLVRAGISDHDIHTSRLLITSKALHTVLTDSLDHHALCCLECTALRIRIQPLTLELKYRL